MLPNGTLKSRQYAVVPDAFASPTDQLPGNAPSKVSKRIVVCARALTDASQSSEHARQTSQFPFNIMISSVIEPPIRETPLQRGPTWPAQALLHLHQLPYPVAFRKPDRGLGRLERQSSECATSRNTSAPCTVSCKPA